MLEPIFATILLIDLTTVLEMNFIFEEKYVFFHKLTNSGGALVVLVTMVVVVVIVVVDYPYK